MITGTPLQNVTFIRISSPNKRNLDRKIYDKKREEHCLLSLNKALRAKGSPSPFFCQKFFCLRCPPSAIFPSQIWVSLYVLDFRSWRSFACCSSPSSQLRLPSRSGQTSFSSSPTIWVTWTSAQITRRPSTRHLTLTGWHGRECGSHRVTPPARFARPRAPA